MTKPKNYKEEQNQPAIGISVTGEVTQVYGIFFMFFYAISNNQWQGQLATSDVPALPLSYNRGLFKLTLKAGLKPATWDFGDRSNTCLTTP